MPHKIVVVGGLTRDAEVKGKMVVFGVGSTEGKSTKYFNCVAFEGDFSPKGFELLGGLKKGSQLMLDGKLRDGEYTNKEGKVVKTSDLVVADFNFVGGVKKTEGTSDVKKPADKVASTEDDSVPF